MNNVTKLSIVLLLSLGVSGLNYAGGCNNDSGCNTSGSCNTSSDCNTSGDCNTCSSDSNCVSTVIVPRAITTNLTYRNIDSFYNRYHDARCNFFIWDSTYLYTQNRRGKDLAAGFLGQNSILVAEAGDNIGINSINLGLGSEVGEGFSSTLKLKPRSKTFAWLSQFIFNLDCFCTGFWADVSFAVAHTKHRLGFSEVNGVPGDLVGQATDLQGELNNLGVFFNSPVSATTTNGCCDDDTSLSTDSCSDSHTGVDSVLLRVGYDYTYCNNDHFGIYFAGLAPTGKQFDNSRWFQPQVGSKHGAVGVGLEGDYTVWCDDCSNSDFVVMSELLYLYKFKHKERRAFDLNNGPLSRFLLTATSTDPFAPLVGNLLGALTPCVEVEPRSQIEWWVGLHYQWCNWGAEFSYNLFWRDRERIKCANFNFDDLGLFDNTRCGALTSNSSATIGQAFGTGTPDATFTNLTSADVNFGSGAARRGLTHTVGGALSYSNVWCDCYPYYLSIGGSYEFASCKDRRHLPENWTVFGKATISF